MPPHTSTENQKNKRKAELEELESRYADLGIDFKAHLEMSELADLAQRHGLKVEGPPGKKAFKRDYLFAVELHYANERIKAGNSPVEHLHPDFNGAARSTAYLRQLLTQYGFTYTTGPEPKHIGDASCVHLHQLFAQKVGEMRTIHSTVGKLVAAMEETVLAALQFVQILSAAGLLPGPKLRDIPVCTEELAAAVADRVAGEMGCVGADVAASLRAAPMTLLQAAQMRNAVDRIEHAIQTLEREY